MRDTDTASGSCGTMLDGRFWIRRGHRQQNPFPAVAGKGWANAPNRRATDRETLLEVVGLQDLEVAGGPRARRRIDFHIDVIRRVGGEGPARAAIGRSRNDP